MGEKDHSDKQLAGAGGLSYAGLAAIDAVRRASADPIERAALLADVCRRNTLYMHMQAGPGHIGPSFSTTALTTWCGPDEPVCRPPAGGCRMQLGRWGPAWAAR